MARALKPLVALALVLAGCSPATSPEPAVDGSRPRIVSLNPCTDAILVEVADPKQILALSHYSHDPAATSIDPQVAAHWPATSGTVEEVLALQPDLVLASTYLSPATREAFARLGLPLAQVGVPATVAESRAQVRRIALLAGHPQRGEALVARIDAALAAAAPPPGSAALATVVWQQGGMVPGEATLIADLLRHAGLSNAAAARGLGQADLLGLEVVLADPPAVLLQVSSQGQAGLTDSLLMGHPTLARLDQTTLAQFDPRLNYCGGPTIIRAVERLAQVRQLALGKGRGA